MSKVRQHQVILKRIITLKSIPKIFSFDVNIDDVATYEIYERNTIFLKGNIKKNPKKNKIKCLNFGSTKLYLGS